MPERAVALLLCPDPDTYARAVESSVARSGAGSCIIPVIAAEARALRGFPPGLETRLYGDPDAWREPTSVVPWDEPAPGGRLCVTTPDPTCRAAARLLSAHTGRRIQGVEDPAAWEPAIRRVYAGEAMASVAFFVPGWTADHARCTPEWLKRTLTLMRSLQAQVGDQPWGIVTAPHAAALTHLVAKSLLHRAVAARYAAAPGFILTTDERAGPFPRYDDHAARLVHAFDRSTIDDRTAVRLAGLSATFLAVDSHGRSYCAVAGLLCGARDLASAPEVDATHCVMGMDCADPALFRVDPRRYDSPVLVLDCCSSANWGSHVWDTGAPSLAYYAAAGPASALLVGDGLTQVPHDSAFDLVWALLTAPTLGHAAVRLNAVRPKAAAAFPYFLLGDPEIVAGPRRWAAWVNEPAVVAEAGGGPSAYRCTLPPTSDRPLFDRVRVPRSAASSAGQTLFVTGEDGADASFSAQYRYGDETELWFQRHPAEPARPLRLISRPSVRLPRSVVEAARTIGTLVSPWSMVFAQAKPALRHAADAVVAVNRKLDQLVGHAAALDATALESTVASALDGWCAAQQKCCDVLREHTRSGLPPWYLWQGENWQVRTVETPCVTCGLTPTIERTYESSPGPARRWSECNRCDITTDRPLVPGYPVVTVDAPSEVRHGSDSVVRIRIGGDGSAPGWGAAFVGLVQRNHGVIADPATFAIRGDRTEAVEHRVTLTLPAPSPAPHLYRLVVLVLLNGHWHWSCRWVLVRR